MEIFLIRLLSIFINQYSLLLFEFIMLTSFLIFILLLLVGNALFSTYRFTHPNEDYFYNYYDNPPIADYYMEV